MAFFSCCPTELPFFSFHRGRMLLLARWLFNSPWKIFLLAPFLSISIRFNKEECSICPTFTLFASVSRGTLFSCHPTISSFLQFYRAIQFFTTHFLLLNSKVAELSSAHTIKLNSIVITHKRAPSIGIGYYIQYTVDNKSATSKCPYVPVY